MVDDAKAHHLVGRRKFLLDDREMPVAIANDETGKLCWSLAMPRDLFRCYTGRVELQRKSLQIRPSLTVRQITQTQPLKPFEADLNA
jgi:hypothetical protein